MEEIKTIQPQPDLGVQPLKKETTPTPISASQGETLQGKRSSKKWLMIGIAMIILILITSSAYFFLNSNKQVACTTEAKLCPNGASVGRTGPKCEFAKCPIAKSTSTPTPTCHQPLICNTVNVPIGCSLLPAQDRCSCPMKYTCLTPTPTCRPRPACLDATPRCMIAETSDMCPSTITPSR